MLPVPVYMYSKGRSVPHGQVLWGVFSVWLAGSPAEVPLISEAQNRGGEEVKKWRGNVFDLLRIPTVKWSNWLEESLQWVSVCIDTPTLIPRSHANLNWLANDSTSKCACTHNIIDLRVQCSSQLHVPCNGGRRGCNYPSGTSPLVMNACIMLSKASVAVVLFASLNTVPCYSVISGDLIKSLPGWSGPLPSPQYSGYIKLNPTSGKRLHYW